MTVPEISCILPTYENPALVARCLTSVGAQRDIDFEIIVTDDSVSDQVRDLVGALGVFAPGVRFASGPRSGNPVDNWNAGLAMARAPARVVVHHDEFLVDPGFLRKAVDALARTGAAAAVGGTTVIGMERPSRFALISALLGRLPGATALLPAFNWIGPTACFVFRGDHRFDPSLVQLVDVEFYARVMARGGVVRLPGTAVGSLGHHGAQITARIDPIALGRQEMAMLAARAPPGITPLSRWLCVAASRLRGGGG